MKKKKMVLILVILIVCAGFFYGSAYAAAQDYICNVDQVGTKGAVQTRVMLTEEGGAFTQKWFYCRDERKKEMMAIMLTALTAGLQVQIRTDLSSATVPEITRLFIIAP
jgi:hypothetical protein